MAHQVIVLHDFADTEHYLTIIVMKNNKQTHTHTHTHTHTKDKRFALPEKKLDWRTCNDFVMTMTSFSDCEGLCSCH